MKKINILVILFGLSLFLTSCEEDEDPIGTPKNYVAGKWVITEIGELVTVNSQHVIRYEEYVNDSDCGSDNYAFDEDFTFTKTDFQFDATCTENVIEGAYSRQGGVITLTYTDEASEPVEKSITVTSLTPTTMDVNYSEGGEMVFLKLERE